MDFANITQVFQIVGVLVAIIMSFIALFRNSNKESLKSRDEQNQSLALITKEQNDIAKELAEKLSKHMQDDSYDLGILQTQHENMLRDINRILEKLEKK